MTETAATPPFDPPSQPLFIRPREGRMIGGVCAGIAHRWNLDITLVRIVAVAVGITTGVGVVAYLAAWLLTPSTDGPARWRPETMSGRFGRLPMLLLIVLGAIVVAGLAHTLWWGVPTGLVVLALTAGILVGTRGGRRLLAVVAALLALSLAAVGVFGSHFGTRTFHVASASDLRGSYDYGVGAVRLDLSSMSVAGVHDTSVHLGRGDVTVTVPPSAAVVVHARSGVGSVTVDGHRVSGVDAEQTRSLGAAAANPSDRLTLDIVVGVGDVDVRTS